MSTDPTPEELRTYDRERAEAEWEDPDHWSKRPPVPPTYFEEEDRWRNFVDLGPGD